LGIKRTSKLKGLTTQRLIEVLGYYVLTSREEAIKVFNITDETFGRYLREARERGLNIDKSKALSTIANDYNDKELMAIAKGGRIVPGQTKVPVIDFNGHYVKIGAMTDTHIGSIYTDPEMVLQAFKVFEDEKVDFITHSGDLTEGMSNRPGHIYELSELGYTAQRDKAVEIFDKRSAEMYMIDGNHDRWFMMSNGALIGPDIAEKTGATFLGHDEGDISIAGSIIKLWHGLDANSYAHSYRLQKLIEALTGGEKPNILLAGHVHKTIYIMERHIHCYSVGAIQKQTKWMRGKRIPSH